LNNNNRQSCWSGAHCHRGSLMAVSTSGGVVQENGGHTEHKFN